MGILENIQILQLYRYYNSFKIIIMLKFKVDLMTSSLTAKIL